MSDISNKINNLMLFKKIKNHSLPKYQTFLASAFYLYVLEPKHSISYTFSEDYEELEKYILFHSNINCDDFSNIITDLENWANEKIIKTYKKEYVEREDTLYEYNSCQFNIIKPKKNFDDLKMEYVDTNGLKVTAEFLEKKALLARAEVYFETAIYFDIYEIDNLLHIQSDEYLKNIINSSDSAIKGSDFSFHFADGSTTPILQIIKDFGNSEYMSDFRKKQSNGKAQRNIFENYLKNANHTKLNQKEIDSALQVLSLETNKKSGAKKHKK
ncbi:MAG: hypothetical protein MR350_06150 [Alphaproteobacteria bacterium]|nr:hypothetical protein [Alphaproteobacteria bacterium]